MMRYFSLLLLLCCFGLALPACAQQNHTQKKTAKNARKKPAPVQARGKPQSEAGPVLTFERTPCFGTCPAYVMLVFADGRVAYEGRRAVPVMGKQELKLPTVTVAELLRQAKEAHFDQFEDRYSRNTSDLPSIIVAVRQPSGKLKTVVLEEGAPENVRALFNAFSVQFDQLAQLNGSEK